MTKKISKKEIQGKIEESVYSVLQHVGITFPSKKTILLIAKTSKKISRQIRHEIERMAKKEKKDIKLPKKVNPDKKGKKKKR